MFVYDTIFSLKIMVVMNNTVCSIPRILLKHNTRAGVEKKVSRGLCFVCLTSAAFGFSRGSRVYAVFKYFLNSIRFVRETYCAPAGAPSTPLQSSSPRVVLN